MPNQRDWLVNEGERVYNERLRGQLESSHPDEFVAIDPSTGEYFLGATLTDAINAGRTAHPDRLFFGMRIGHDVAAVIGGCRP